MVQYTWCPSLEMYRVSSAGRSSTSLDSSMSNASMQVLQPFKVINFEETSVMVARVILKSSLAQRIAGARKNRGSHSEYDNTVNAQPVEHAQKSEQMTRREFITAKFLENEKQWKEDACRDTNRRIAQGISSLGI